MTNDKIEWDDPVKDEDFEWGIPESEPQTIPRENPFTQVLRHLRRIDTRWITVLLLAGMVFMSTIVVIQNNRIAQLENELDVAHDALDALQEDYDTLLSDYNDLFSDYQQLEVAFEDPLINPVVPTISQVRSWLARDTTDQCEYVDSVWSCGDFAAMLMAHAKEMNWRVRIAVIFYSLQGEPYYGSTLSVYGSHGHAFNVIECNDGIWYIEPQTDGTWYLVTGGTQERTEFDIFRYYDFVDSTHDTLWDGLYWWTNFYSQFA